MVATQAETYHSVNQVARLVPHVDGRKCSPRTVWRWIYQGVGGRKLEAEKIGGRTVISVSALQSFLSGGGVSVAKASRIETGKLALTEWGF